MTQQFYLLSWFIFWILINTSSMNVFFFCLFWFWFFFSFLSSSTNRLISLRLKLKDGIVGSYCRSLFSYGKYRQTDLKMVVQTHTPKPAEKNFHRLGICPSFSVFPYSGYVTVSGDGFNLHVPDD